MCLTPSTLQQPDPDVLWFTFSARIFVMSLMHTLAIESRSEEEDPMPWTGEPIQQGGIPISASTKGSPGHIYNPGPTIQFAAVTAESLPFQKAAQHVNNRPKIMCGDVCVTQKAAVTVLHPLRVTGNDRHSTECFVVFVFN